MAEIVLIQAPFEDFYKTPLRTYPLGLLYIASGLIARGYGVSLIDGLAEEAKKQVPLPEEMGYMKEHYIGDKSPFSLFSGYYRFGASFEDILRRVKDHSPRLVFMSLLTTAYSSSGFELAKMIRQECPDVILICGGHHATRFPAESLQVFDYVIRGEGDRAAGQLADALLKRGSSSPGQIEGVCFKKGSERVIKDPVFVSEEELSGMVPAREIAPVPRSRGRGFTQILTSRGCPLSCTYCCTAEHLCGGFRQRKIGDILSECKTCYDTCGITHFDIEDENFTFEKERAQEILKGLKKLFDGKDVEFSAMNGLLPETLDEEIVLLMKEAGFNTLNLSIGSTNKEVLKKYNRPGSLLDRFDAIVHGAQTCGLSIIAYTISGGPYASRDQVIDDIIYMAVRPVQIGLSTYYPAPGSYDYEHDVYKKPEHFSLYRSSVYAVEGLMNRIEMVTGSRIARLLNYIKTLPQKGIHSLHDIVPAQTGSAIGPGQESKLAALFIKEKRIPGIEPKDRTVFIHRADDRMIEECVAALKEKGYIRGYKGDVEI